MFCDLVGNVTRLFTSISGGGSRFSPFLDGSWESSYSLSYNWWCWWVQVEWMMLPGVFVGKMVTIR